MRKVAHGEARLGILHSKTMDLFACVPAGTSCRPARHYGVWTGPIPSPPDLAGPQSWQTRGINTPTVAKLWEYPIALGGWLENTVVITHINSNMRPIPLSYHRPSPRH